MMSLHINHYAKKRGKEKKLILAVRTVMLQEHVDMVAGDFNLHGAANLAVILDPLALLKKRSSIRTYLCHPAPHRWEAREACQVNGRTCAGS